MQKALCIAADAGVDVRLVVPAIPDKKYVYMVAETYWGELLAHGVKIYRYTPGFVHAKSVMVDREVALVGSTNMDYRTFQLHYECAVLLYHMPAVEDLLEEIVGNILDEYDAEEEYISALEDGFVLNGMTPLEEVEEALGITFEEEDMDSYDTLNGFLVSRLGHIPKKDEHSDVMYGGYQFHILSMENKTIRSVKATRVPVEKQTEEKEGSLL